MKRTITWERRAWKALQDIAARQPVDARRIVEAIERFATEEVGDIKKLQGVHPDTWRLRSGDWRVRFRLEGETMIVVAVKSRRDAYE